MAGQLLSGLVRAGIEVDAFVSVDQDALPEHLLSAARLRFVCRPSSWEYHRWYSRSDATTFATGMVAQSVGQVALGRAVSVAHRKRRYDLVYQFSHPELTALRPYLRALPPIVLHPEVHAAGELRWQRRERALALSCGPRRRYNLACMALNARAKLQERDMPLAAAIISPSGRFAELLCEDYRLVAGRIHVVANPIDLDRFSPGAAPRAPGPIRLVYVSRLAVRKGVEMIVGLSHRLADLRGRVTIEVIGNHSLWSDYRGLLGALHPSIATYRGVISGTDAPQAYREADGLLQPSHYEPFALTVGEALATGLPVITSDEVGASEHVSPQCCERFVAGNLDAFEACVRRLVDRLESGAGRSLGQTARLEARRLFGSDVIAAQLAAALKSVAPPSDGRAASRAG
jgi:glycosyltransferase involved in cell wall biosynthesis